MLTGTPLQNNLLELMSLLIFTVPKLFSARSQDITKMFAFNSVSLEEKLDDKSTNCLYRRIRAVATLALLSRTESTMPKRS